MSTVRRVIHRRHFGSEGGHERTIINKPVDSARYLKRDMRSKSGRIRAGREGDIVLSSR